MLMNLLPVERREETEWPGWQPSGLTVAITTKMDWMEGSDKPGMDWVVLTWFRVKSRDVTIIKLNCNPSEDFLKCIYRSRRELSWTC